MLGKVFRTGLAVVLVGSMVGGLPASIYSDRLLGRKQRGVQQ